MLLISLIFIIIYFVAFVVYIIINLDNLANQQDCLRKRYLTSSDLNVEEAVFHLAKFRR